MKSTDSKPIAAAMQGETIILPAEIAKAPQQRTIASLAKERHTPDWLVAALKHHFRNRPSVTAAEFDAEAKRIANHPIGGGR